MAIGYTIRGFDPQTAVIDVDYSTGVSNRFVVPVDASGNVPTGAELDEIIQFFHPAAEVERRAALQSPGNRDAVAALVQPRGAPPAAAAGVVTDRQFAQALAEQGTITWPEAHAWGARGEIPAALMGAVDEIPDTLTRNRAIMFLSAAQTYERKHPMTLMLAGAMGWDADDLDALWAAAAAL